MQNRAASRRCAFTLIELLIVVAIIAILAAIAVPNFLEAQVRSKVARAKTDMRSVATALEAYAVDSSKYPWAPSSVTDLDGYGNVRAYAFLTVPDNLTTPVAYLTSHVADVFRIGRSANIGPNQGKPYASGDPQDMTYWYLNTRQAPDPDYQFFPPTSLPYALELDGEWRLGSLGPQSLYVILQTGGTLYSPDSVYDPTNGTVSRGMIFRSQKKPEVNNAGANPDLLD